LAHWIAVFQAAAPALEIWRGKRTMPWLIAALATSKSPEAIEAAHAVKRDSPGYDSAVYYGILAQIRAGDPDAARVWADEAMASKPADSTMNLLKAERLRLARDWTEFLKFAPRRAVAESSDEDGSDGPVYADTAKEKPFALDADSVRALNETVPLSLWVNAAGNRLLAANLQGDVAQAGWVRSVILDDAERAHTFALRVAALKPDLAGEMRSYLAEKDAAAARFAAVFLMLRAPGFEPVLRPGLGRATPVTKSDMLRDNWWMLERNLYGDSPEHQALFDLYPDGHFGPTGFLPEAQRSAGAKEWQELSQRAGNSVNFLCGLTLDWARAHPQDARVPQALHLAVEATHYGPSSESSSYSKEAFDLLHRRYPTSEWTKKTKYWY
jgi:hypothetical protein